MLPPNFKRAAAREDESKAEAEEKVHFDNNEDSDYAVANGMLKTNIPRGRPSRKSAPPTVGAGLTEKMEKLKVDGNGAEYFSFDSFVPVLSKQ